MQGDTLLAALQDAGEGFAGTIFMVDSKSEFETI